MRTRGQAKLNCSGLMGLFAVNAFIVLICSSLSAFATIPAAATNDPRYKLGYLVVTNYPGVDAGGTSDSLAGLQEAVNDAYSNGLVVLFPSGTYLISDTLHCRAFHLTTGTNSSGAVVLGSNPCSVSTYILQGSCLGPRPVIKLADAPVGNFDNTNSVRPLLMYRLYQSTNFPNQVQMPPPATNILGAPAGYFVNSDYLMNWELRNLDFDCNGHSGAVGVVFPAAQGSLVCNVRINATNAFAGFLGLPGANWGAVNIEVNGGRYGIRTGRASGNIGTGTSVFGARLANQRVAAIEQDDAAPLMMAGFKIVKADAPAITVMNSAYYSTLPCWDTMSLLDGSIEIIDASTTNVVMSNEVGKNFYLRNVYVAGATSLVHSATLPALAGSGSWSLIDEYSYTDQRATVYPFAFATRSMMDGIINADPERVRQVTPNSGAPPYDLVLRHLPMHGMPVYEGTGSPPTIVVTDPPYNAVPGDALDDTAAIQQAIDDASAGGHGRVMIPKFNTSGTLSGAFLLTNTLILRSNTVLFGAAKGYVSQLCTHSSWRPVAPANIIQTEDNASASTYLGNLAILTDVSVYRNPFTAYHWKAGRASETFNLRVKWPFEWDPPVSTSFYSVVQFSGNAGGRHYFSPQGTDREWVQPGYSSGTNNRTVRITGTTQPLWLYGFNVECGGLDLRRYDVEITSSANIRWLGLKRESGSIMLLSSCTNFAIYSVGGLRQRPRVGEGFFEVTGSSSNLLLANLLVAQAVSNSSPAFTLLETISGLASNFVPDPEGISLYKRGITDDDAMRLPVTLPRIGALTINSAVLQLQLDGCVVGYNYAVESSSNLLDTWHSWRVVMALTSQVEVLDTAFTNTPIRFYRAVPE